MSGVVIVGGGQAGAQVAFSLRDLGYPGPVVIVAEERFPPYQRPPLSKSYLVDGDVSTLEFREPDFYPGADIELVIGDPITDVTPELKRVATRSGRLLRYDKLVLATGVQARRLPVPGADAAGVLSLRDVQDAELVKSALGRMRATGGSAIVVGAGYIGLEVAAAFTGAGVHVSVVEALPRVLARGVGVAMSDAVAEAHVRRGVDLRLGTGVTEVATQDGHVVGVRLSDGALLACDVLIVGVGAEPRIELASGLGVEVDNGILVDDGCNTSVPDILAVGDCAAMRFPWSPTAIRLESVANAVEHGRIAAGTIAGTTTQYTMPPWFWSDQGDVRLQMAGWFDETDELILRGDPASESMAVLHFRGAQLVGVEAMNSPGDFAAAKRALAHGMTIDRGRARDSSRRLKDAVV